MMTYIVHLDYKANYKFHYYSEDRSELLVARNCIDLHPLDMLMWMLPMDHMTNVQLLDNMLRFLYIINYMYHILGNE